MWGGGEAERGVRTKRPCLAHTGLRNIRALTREGRVGVQLADALLQQAEAERQRGRVVEQVEHDAVSGGLVSCDLLALKFHHLLDKVGRLGLVVPQQFVEYFQDSVCNFPLGQHNFLWGGEKNTQINITWKLLDIISSKVNANTRHLLSRTAVRSGGEGQEHRVPQEVQVGLETGDAQPRPQINRQAALDQSADQVAEAASQRVFLAARFNLVQLHLQQQNNIGLVTCCSVDHQHSNTIIHLNINDYLPS